MGPCSGLKTDRAAAMIIKGDGFMQILRRGRYELGVEADAHLRAAGAFDDSAH
jgi:transposase, IS6 family